MYLNCFPLNIANSYSYIGTVDHILLTVNFPLLYAHIKVKEKRVKLTKIEINRYTFCVAMSKIFDNYFTLN